MTKQVWLPVDGALLKKLREDAGVEVTTLARLHSLSSSQIKQLENGGDSSFYTPSIKLATGRKLLMHFGADIQPLEKAPDPDRAQELETPAKAVHVTQATDVELEKKNSLLSLQIVGAVVVLISLIYWDFFIQQQPVKKSQLLKESNQQSLHQLQRWLLRQSLSVQPFQPPQKYLKKVLKNVNGVMNPLQYLGINRQNPVTMFM